LIEENKHLIEEEKSLLKSVSFVRLMIPVVLGLGVFLPVLSGIYGARYIRPGVEQFADLNGYGVTLIYYIMKSVGSLGALIWRLTTYDSYLILGAIIIPIWIRDIMVKRRMLRSQQT
jgi:hypothetical protein